ncbi:hypothetical protein [Desulfobaculum bizertense]|uniref:Uncharacterized protein n=1 Tax=Desulfobaculum bizertense DSM 18034 TaxID=1121442 RepID=A0A1T4VJ85_9BACT|nr:hypothetical protein [Desulfobaculum bizertense]SKA65012.1 hypothetical protein SAMN02745702_00447 [Desulfobaculum bizertense DSM 18034]
MAHYDKKHLMVGSSMGLVFLVLLALMFSPLYGDGMNALEYSDHLFNTIAKGSTEYIPGLEAEVQEYDGEQLELTLKAPTDEKNPDELAMRIAAVLGKVADVSVENATLTVSGAVSPVLNTVLEDSMDMFENRGDTVSGRYGMDERLVLFTWWQALGEMSQELKHQGGKEKTQLAAFMDSIQKRAVEVGYNFYGIEPEHASDRAGVLTFALVFYIFYTVWWGMTIFYLFEGLGLVMSAGDKKEV